jgi:phosphopantetheinyl transferase
MRFSNASIANAPPTADSASALIVEHGSELCDDELLALADWSRDDLDHLGHFRHQASKTSWCVSRRIFDDVVLELEGIDSAHRMLIAGEYGKPSLPRSELRFNWSHAEGCVALAFVYGREIGVDIERRERPRGDYLDIARACFRADEYEWVESSRGDESWSRFLSLFVQKEAWLKNIGRGLSFPLDEAPASLALPPARWPGKALLDVGEERSYLIAIDASRGAVTLPHIRVTMG